MTHWIRYSTPLALGIVLVGVNCLAPTLFAAEAPEAGRGEEPAAREPDAAGSEQADGDKTIMGMILDSGPTGWGFMLVLGLFSLAGATVAVERASNTTRSKILPPPFIEELRRLESEETVRPEALRTLSSRGTTPIAGILKAGLLRAGRPLPEIEKSMEDATAREMAALRSRIRPLNIIGSVAPLVGLLGTVVGMILAFQQTASYVGPDKGEMLARGIYLALVTTAAGLTIAIPCLLLAAYFNSKVERFFREIDEHLMEVLPVLDRIESPLPPAAPQERLARPQPALAAAEGA